ncbi:MAG: hypothetical protein CMN30_01275 [Sandaracinus sp.]|nr:hypothetical protein [Sandaracinus sp.]
MSESDSPPATRAEGGARGGGTRPQTGMTVGGRVRLERLLGRGGMAEVWLGRHLTLGVDVAVKFLRLEDEAVLRERFAREAQLAARVDHPHAVRVFDHGMTDAGAPYIVMELVDGETLAQRIERGGPLGTDDVATLIGQLADVLTQAHRMDILHRDIKPHNVMLLGGEKLFAKVVDFGLAKELLRPEDDPSLTQAGLLLGTPAYMAPEQLLEGHEASPRTEAWSLAVLCYEALAGERPFPGRHQAPLALAMMSGRYRPITARRPELPPTMDTFFARALSVRPEQRFESVAALAAALDEALAGTSASVEVEGRLHLPSQLYGRAAELDALTRALESATEGSRFVMIGGYSGVGKTALVEEARRRLAHRGMLFVDGKFDQLHRGSPYDSLLQALRKLLRFMSARPPESFDGWRAQLGELPDEVADVLVDFVPELADVLDRPDAGRLATPPLEARHRFHNAIRRLLHGVARPDRPLVLFLDDLQWADPPTLELLPRLIGPGDRNVLIVGSYRSNEVTQRHPLRATLEELREEHAPLVDLEIGPLDEDAVLAMLGAALGPGEGRVRLAVLCHEKTRGNPLFLRHFLETLHEEGALVFDARTGGWSYDPSAARFRRVDADVVDFIASELRGLPAETGACLASASCIGPDFDLGTLAHLLGVDRRQVLERLRPALTHDLVAAISEDDWDDAHLGFHRIRFRFAHDRVQQAARSLCSAEEIAASHRKMAELLLVHTDPQERETRLFELVEHLNRSGEQTSVMTDAAQVRALNVSAARRATRAAAFAPADVYYRKAVDLFDDGLWEHDYAEAFALHVEAARSAGLVGERETMARLVAEARAHARTPVDAVVAREVAMHGLMAEQKFGEALELAKDLLAELGEPLPDPAEVPAEVGAIIELLAGLDGVDALERASDPRVLAAQRIRQGVMSTAYVSAPELFPLLPCAIIRSTMRNGITDHSAYGFAVFGMVLNALDFIDLSFETAKMARSILAKTDDHSNLAKTRHILNGHVEPFVLPLSESVDLERSVYEQGLDTGDLEYAAWALHLMVAHAFYSGMRLGALRELDRKNGELLEQMRQLPAHSCTQPFSQAIRNCIGEDVVSSSRLIRPEYHEDEQMDRLVGVGFRGAAYILTVMRTFVRFLFRDVEGALRAADAGAEFADGATATYHQVWWQQLRALAALGARGADAADEARAALAKIERWCASSEANHRHRVALLSAELARVEGRDGDALQAYDAAISHARDHGFMHEEALANELAARFYLGKGSEPAARGYLAEARQVYEAWGSLAKVEHLDEELGHVFQRRSR